MNPKIYVIYHHADFDGIFSREIAKQFLGEKCTFIGWDYGEPIPEIPAGVQLYMIDISVDGLMDYPGLIWIDHHKSAIEKYPKTIYGYRIDGVAACRLAWQWFSQDHTDVVVQFGGLPTKEQYFNHEVTEPLSVCLAGEYDIWDKRDPRAELFQHGLRSRDLTKLWPMLCGGLFRPTIAQLEEALEARHPYDLRVDGFVDPSYPVVNELLECGKAIEYAQTRQNESVIKAYGFTVRFEGICFLVCNHARFNSHLFTAGIKPEHDALMGFNYDGKKWRTSLYHAPGKEHHDLSVIAVKYGGGGHRGACGFRTDVLPYPLEEGP